MDFPDGYQPSQLDQSFFCLILKKINPNAKLTGFTQQHIDSTDSILSALADDSSRERKRKNFTGFSRFQLAYEDEGLKHMKNIVIKSKPPSGFIQNVVLDLAKPAGREMEAMFAEYYDAIIPGFIEHKEVEINNLDVPCIVSISPEVYFTYKDPAKDIYLIVMEDLCDERFELLNTISAVDAWKEKDFTDTLEGLATFHACYMDRTDMIPHQLKKWLQPRVTAQSMVKKKPFLRLLLDHNSKNAPEIYISEVYSLLHKAIDKCEVMYNILYNRVPFTLIHDDVQPRNMCMRKEGTVKHRRLCLYDWEVVRESINLRDVVDFLGNTLPVNASPHLWQKYRDCYYGSLAKSLEVYDIRNEKIQYFMAEDTFKLVFDLCALDCLIDRYNFYMFSHVYRPHDFFVRVMENMIAYVMSTKDVLNNLFDS